MNRKGGVGKTFLVSIEQKADFSLLKNRDLLGTMNGGLAKPECLENAGEVFAVFRIG